MTAMEEWIDLFKEICAEVATKAAYDGKLYAAKAAGKYSVSDEIEFLKQAIKDFIECDDEHVGMSFRQLQDIEKVLIYEMCLSDTDNLMAISFLNLIWSLGGFFLPLNNTEQWIDALRYSARILEIEPSGTFTKFNLRSANPRAYDTGQAYKRLQEWGVVLKREGLDIVVASGWEDLVSQLEAVMREIGGANLVMLVCRHLKANNHYSERLRRYLFGWLNSFNPTRPTEVLPYAFVLNLAAKNVLTNEPKDVPDLDGKLQYISDVTKTMFASRGLLRYGIFETQLLSSENIVRYVERLAVYDSIYALPQVDLEIEELTLKSCFGWVNEQRFESYCKFSLNDFLRVSRYILSGMKGVDIPMIVYKTDVVRHFKDDPIKGLDEILTALSTEACNVNRGYIRFDDFEKINITLRPLIRVSPTKFIVLEKGWVGGGFFQTLMTVLREGRGKGQLKGDPDRVVGEQFEKMVKTVLEKNNITYYSGKYNEDGIEGDCDIAIEAADAIILIEVKKKQLSAKARAGAPVHIFLDLASSLLSAQVQAAKTELVMRRNESLELLSNGTVSRIELNGRSIERIAITQYDFNSFQDRAFTERFLKILHDSDFSISGQADADIEKGSAFMADQSKELRLQMANLASLESRYQTHPFFDCWFLSFAQLSLLLEGVKSNDDLLKNVMRTKSVGLNTNNFYYEYSIFPTE
jgi:hypothetical protein